MLEKQDKWDDAYQSADISSAVPARVLEQNAFLLPGTGIALDLACGRGGNALFLATQGNPAFHVDAVDLSPVVLAKLADYAASEKLSVNCMQRDVEALGLPDKRYDVVVVSYFLDRELFPSIIRALNPDGLLFYQTWSQLRVDDSGPSNPDFRLRPGELLMLGKQLRPLFYRENGIMGDLTQGIRNEAMLVAQKL